ncbi:MAG TPA: hypothetical protein VGX27_07680 [Candidatus Dormibacteraeota bacterium]|nr:hypothetical protein [Candidatus Dormibacteraeota bacterium]
MALKPLLLLIAAALLLGGETWPHSEPAAPLAGFSFSPETSVWAGRDPVADLTLLLDVTQPDLVRLPVYWDDVEPAPNLLDFESIDSLLKAIRVHNRTAAHPTRVVLTIGARNFLYPELHEPDWAGPREQPFLAGAQDGPEYRKYFDASIARYRNSRLLYAWQVENEPFDEVTNDSTGADQISASQLAWEVSEVHRLDPAHQVVVTTYNGLNVFIDLMELYAPSTLLGVTYNGHPQAALNAADALGLDLYVDGPNVPYRHLTTVYVREQWKQQILHFWANRAAKQGKPLWLSEMQAQPWMDSDTFQPKDLLASAVDYRQENLQVVLMWGVETWLNDPAWLSAGARALQILRS